MLSVECPPADEDYCEDEYPYGYKGKCDWSQVPKECPFMCGMCKGPQDKPPPEEDGKSSSKYNIFFTSLGVSL